MTQKVIIASRNPTKVHAVEKAFKMCFPRREFYFELVDVESGVADQPMSDKETRDGAIGRAMAAQQLNTNADFCVGIEGGIQDIDGEFENFAWVAVLKGGRLGKAKTATFFLPEVVSKNIRAGKELAEADDMAFGRKNSGVSTGTVGLLTDDLITRASYQVEAVILALIPHMNPDFY